MLTCGSPLLVLQKPLHVKYGFNTLIRYILRPREVLSFAFVVENSQEVALSVDSTMLS